MKKRLSARQSFLVLELMVVFLFIVVTAAVMLSQSLTDADLWVLGVLYATRLPFLFDTFSYITLLGNTLAITVAASAIGLFLLFTKRFSLAVGLAVATIGAASTEVTMKILIERVRPSGFSDLLPSSFSYPSGHATASMALYGFITYALLVVFPKQRVLILSLGAFFILSVGISRLYLGVHYPSDVLGGYLLAAVWIFIAARVMHLMRK